MGIWVSSVPSILAVVPGEEARFHVRVGNTGSLVDQVSVRVLGEPATWTEVDPSLVQLLPGGESEVEVLLRPPREPSSRAGRHTLGIRFTSREDPDSSAIEQSVVEVAPFEDTRSAVHPTSARTRREATFRLTIDNRGNHAIDAAVTALDPERVLVVTLDSARLRVEPGRQGAVAIRAVAPALLVGPLRELTIEIGLAIDGAEPSQLRASLVRAPRLPAWLVPIGGLAATAVLGWLVAQGQALIAAVLAIGAGAVGLVRVRKARANAAQVARPSPDRRNERSRG